MEYQQVLKITIYCSFDFTSYPFDSHKCDFNFGMKEITSKSMQLNATLVRYMQYTTKYGQNILPIFNATKIPFDISLESLKPYENFQAGFNYSTTGMRIHLIRNNFDELIGKLIF